MSSDGQPLVLARLAEPVLPFEGCSEIQHLRVDSEAHKSSDPVPSPSVLERNIVYDYAGPQRYLDR